MANISEESSWDPVYQLEKNDSAIGGVDGKANLQAKQLVKRTGYLKDRLIPITAFGSTGNYTNTLKIKTADGREIDFVLKHQYSEKSISYGGSSTPPFDAIPRVYKGTGVPTKSLGKEGDIYVIYSSPSGTASVIFYVKCASSNNNSYWAERKFS